MNSKLLQKNWVVISIALFCSVLWGSAFPTLKISYLELNIAPDNTGALIVLAGIRFFLAAILIWSLVLLGIKGSLKIPLKTFGELMLLGILQISLTYYFYYIGLAHTQGMKGAILQSFGTFLVVLLAHFVYTDDKLSWRKWLGLTAGFTGIVLANFGKSFDLSFYWRGEGFLLLAGVTTAIGMLLAKHLCRSIHPFIVTGWQMFIGSVLLIGVGLPQMGSFTFIFTPKAWILLFYSSFISATALSLWFFLLKYNKAGEISIYRFMVPVSGTILSAAFIPGENPTYMMGLALLLVTIGIISINYQKKQTP